jgi:hypothetical protein
MKSDIEGGLYLRRAAAIKYLLIEEKGKDGNF